MPYGLSVDLGTTYTAAATLPLEDPPRPEVLGLGNRALQIPSVLFLLPDGDVLVGEAAERRAVSDPSRVAREFKRRLGDPVPLVVAGSPYSAQSLTARLLRSVLAQATELRGGPPSWVVLTHPANWGPFKLDLLRQAAAMADLPEVGLCPEPVGAALQYAATHPVAAGERVCVFDLGGGTFDACVLVRTATGFEILGRPDGVEHLGGADFDEAVFRRVLGGLAVDPATLDPRDPALARLRRDCVDAKEALSADPESVVVATLGGRSAEVRLTRAELEEMIRPAVREALDATTRTLRSAQVLPAALRTVVLIGGSSRIPLVAEMVVEAFGRPVARTTHPKHDVVLGALWTGPGVELPPPAAVPAADPTAGTDVVPPIPSEPSRPDVRAVTADPEPPAGPDLSSAEPPTVRMATGGPRSPEPAPESADEIDRRTAVPARRRTALLAVGTALVVTAVGAVVFWPRTAGNGNGANGPVAPATAVFTSTTVAATDSAMADDTATDTTATDTTATDTTATEPGATDTGATDTAGPPGSGLPQSAERLPDNTAILALGVGADAALHPVDTVTGAVGEPMKTQGIEKVAISPDRRSVVYLHALPGVPSVVPGVESPLTELRVVAADGTGDRPLFPVRHPECERYFTPAWSPTDPDRIAVACSVIRPNPEKPNVSAIEEYSLLVLSLTDGTIVSRLPVDFDWFDGMTWSADGTRLAFFGWPWNDRHLSLFTVDVEGPDDRTVTRLTDDHEDFDPVWSARGVLAFRRLVLPDPQRPVYDIAVLGPDSDTPPARIPADSDDNEIDPAWSVDGSRIVYRSSRGLADTQSYRFWTAAADGTDARLVVDRPAAAPPAWGRR